MPQIKRRQFLQFAGSAIATWGMSSCDRSSQPRRIPAGSRGISPRKLALLVGINAYPKNSQLPPLQGCITDVELQRNLLIYRFGFNPGDILTLTDSQATRQGILQAFEQHLINQAKPEDVVVFHFSGHGSQVADPDKDHPDGLNSTLVPFDSSRPSKQTQGGVVQDILGHTLFLLMSAIKTENLTVVLDCCHSGGGKRGNLLVRSVRGGSQFQPSPEEIAYQQKWLSKLNLTPAEFIQRRRAGIAKGIVITATNREQRAADFPFNGFSAGAFTYLLTQYLWQQPGNEPIVRAMPNIARSTTKVSFTAQIPEFEVKPNSNNEKQSIYWVKQPNPPAEAVITKVAGNDVELWLGGVDSASLAAFDKEAIFALDYSPNRPNAQVQLESREGLVGKGKLLDSTQMAALQPGALCTEQVRGIPNNLNLKIGLARSLGKDAEQAKTALTALKRIEVLPLQQGELHYIFGRNAEGRLGLFSPGLETIAGSFGAAKETVTDAIKRLQSKLRLLLAARIVKMTLNTASSQLNVTASLSRSGQENDLIAAVLPTRSLNQKSAKAKSVTPTSVSSPNSQNLPLNTPVQLQIANNETRDLYISVVVIDPSGEMTIIFPYQWTSAEEAARVGAGQTVMIPNSSEASFELRTQEPKGVTEVLIIASATPQRKALKTLQALALRGSQEIGPVALNDPIEVMDSLLDDLADGDRSLISDGDRRSGSSVTKLAYKPQRVRRVDTTQMAAMSMTFEVI